MTSKFSFKFSGFSVWLEPDPDQSSQMISEMEYLRTKCGGSEAGQHMFVPHCTLLYNTSLDVNDGEQADGGDGSCDDQTKHQQAEYMLRQCLEEYHKQTADTKCNDGNQNQQPNDDKQLQLIPTSQYYFPYPKKADNGKGFGCCISLLILDTTPQLKLLHDIVRNRFPPDERHGDSSGDNDDCDNSNGEAEEPRFRPHMALIYAPEDQENVTNGWLEKYTEQNEEQKRYEKWIPAKQKDQTLGDDDGKEGAAGWNAKYLSLWSTEGTLDEWYPIFKLDLEATI